MAENETGGGRVIDYMWTGLVRYPNDGGAPVNALADSITTTDSKTYTIKIKPNTKFHDGTIVKAENFVKAWNFDALVTNNMANASFFSDIQGYNDVNPAPPSGSDKAPALACLRSTASRSSTISSDPERFLPNQV